MADIFVSYSKSDYALALKLSAFLESEGWSVWWDKNLGAADLYRDEIMKQLAAARVVITIWSPNSARSDWVRAEAGRAKADGKLIPVKTSDFTYADIPLPFGEMHTENVASTDLIRAAVVAQLAKPAIPVSPRSQILKILESQGLIWIGILGSAITLFSGLSVIFDLADWARELVHHWHDLTQTFWGWVFGWIGVKLPRELAPVISFTAFSAVLVVGVNFSVKQPWSGSGVLRKGGIFVVGVIFYLLTCLVLLLPIFEWAHNYFIEGNRTPGIFSYSVQAITQLVALAVPMGFLLYVSKGKRTLVAVASLLFLVMGVCLLIAPLLKGFFNRSSTDLEENLLIVSVYFLFQFYWMAVMLFSPLQQLIRRLGFVVLGVLTLVVLNEVSKLNLHQYLKPASSLSPAAITAVS